jgi:hypothetical protein
MSKENMRTPFFILIAVFIFSSRFICLAQGPESSTVDTFNIAGQASLWVNYNHRSDLPVITGCRYIPTIYYGKKFSKNNLLDFEASANVFGSFAFHPFDSTTFDGTIKPYRLWMRYSSAQFELRLGLQKINFGSASILRPLMWFDQMDPRDPLNLTDGVWGLLGRYYFLNNSNIWFWGLYGNSNPRGFEIVPVNKRIPEFGGRIQVPVPSGEVAFSYHHRTADNIGMIIFGEQQYDKIPEDRFGIDAKLDLITGIWIEGSWTRKRKNIGSFTNQEIFNAGIDYTFNLGSGLYTAYEHLLLSYDAKPFRLAETTSFSLLTVSYNITLFDKISAIVYYNWTKKTIYNFLSWQKQFNNITFYLMGYLNPLDYQLPTQTSSQNSFAGKGIQIMMVFNH